MKSAWAGQRQRRHTYINIKRGRQRERESETKTPIGRVKNDAIITSHKNAWRGQRS